MALYSYKAIDERGKTLRGWQDAANLVDLELRLKRIGLDLINARERESRRALGGRRIKRSDLITFFFNMEQLIRAGVPMLECLADLRDSTDDPQLRAVLAGMLESIEGGRTLSQAMAQHPDAFDKIFVSLVHAGEESGHLEEIFEHITESLKWQDEMAAQTKTMMLYPAFVGIVVLCITIFLMTYLVPQLVSFIRGMGEDIPWHTRMLLAASNVFVHYWHILLGLPAALFAGFTVALRYNPGLQYHLDAFKLNIWPIGPILRKIILARFANTFAMMYGAGITILDCITNSRDLVNNQVIARSLDQVHQEIESGKNLTQSFLHTGMFPPLVIRMLMVGETSGELGSALRNVSYFYDRDVKESIKKIQVMIEPAMTILLGLVLGWVMLAVLSPIYDLIGKLKM